ncbi:NAD(P)/FAD-dependent oxidoreductase [Bradyrhizobium sp. WSM3983]|uniref:FAD-dependent oxidoreductase n=1 Tax=Bradyrhizobium sp. WSM3983 TaxID=1038867 RepID=UPI00041D3EC5|nr:NAD(P)/FAD-dependent oxidoreductase [Bradyrhizobium sp. WSM3983]
MTTISRLAIVGGGPGGLMLARLLLLRGFEPVVFERDQHSGERPQGGSLDLHEETGLRAMSLAGLAKEFAAAARPEDQGDRLYDQHGTLLFDRDGAGDSRPEIDRIELRRILLESLPTGVVQWGSRVEAVVPRTEGGYDLVVAGAGQRFDVVIGADGAWSQVRPLLTEDVPRYEGVTLVELGFDSLRHLNVDALVGRGKMFAVGDNRVLIAQRNGSGHIRGYAGLRITESEAQALAAKQPERIRAMLVEAFAGWASELIDMIEIGDFIGVRPLYAMPIGHAWRNHPGVTLLGDAAHLMSPFSGEGVNLALADAVDLADALASADRWEAIAACETEIMKRAMPAAEGAAAGLNGALSSQGAAPVLEHYRERVRG